MFAALIRAAHDTEIGFNHVGTTLDGWFDSLAPIGVSLDEAFLEDMLYACNFLDEVGKFDEMGLGYTFSYLLSKVLKPRTRFDRETNTIKGENK